MSNSTTETAIRNGDTRPQKAMKQALRDKAIHYDYAADLTACQRNNNFRLVTVEPQTLTCKKCRKVLAANPGWRRDYRNW